MSEFQTYLPETWFEDGLAIAASMEPTKQPDFIEKRDSNWQFQISASSIVAGAFAFFSIAIAEQSSASTLNSVVIPDSYPPQIVSASKERKAFVVGLHAEINRDFYTLFDSMRNGAKLDKSAEVRELANAASKLRNQKVDVNAWAKKLADDLKDAKD